MAAGGIAAAMKAFSGAEAVEEWARKARPGETLVYHSGAFLVKSLAAVRAADALIERGEAIPVQVRIGPGQFDYCLQKRANAERQLSAGAINGRKVGSAIDAEEYEQLLAVLRRLANFKQACPSNKELARLAELKDAESVRYRLTQLSIAGVIAVRTPPQGVRVVTIVASGRSTAK